MDSASQRPPTGPCFRFQTLRHELPPRKLLSCPTAEKGEGGEPESAWPVAHPFMSPSPFPLGRRFLSCRLQGPRQADKGGTGGGCGLQRPVRPLSCRSGSGRPRTAPPCQATAATHVSTHVRRGPTCPTSPPACPLLLGLRSCAPVPRGHVGVGSAPASARGRARPPTPGGSGSEHLPHWARPEPPRPGGCHLPGPPRRPSSPQPAALGWAQW